MSSYAAVSSPDLTALLLASQHAAYDGDKTAATLANGDGEADGLAAGRGRRREMGPWNFAISSDRVMCCGFWDHSVKCYGLEGGFKLHANTSGGHRGAINCLKVGEDGITLVTGE